MNVSRAMILTILIGAACASGPVRRGLVPAAARELGMTPEDARACSGPIAALGHLEGLPASDDQVAARTEELRSCVNGNREGLDQALWLDAVEGHLCALHRYGVRIAREIEREKAKTSLVGSAAPSRMYDLAEEAMQVSEQSARMSALLTRFSEAGTEIPLAARAHAIKKKPDCVAAQSLADCVRFHWSNVERRLEFDTEGACAADQDRREALEQLLYGP